MALLVGVARGKPFSEGLRGQLLQVKQRLVDN